MTIYPLVSSAFVTVCAFNPSCFLINVSMSTAIFLSRDVNSSPQRIGCFRDSRQAVPTPTRCIQNASTPITLLGQQPENLKHYDAIFLDSTTGEFLDDPNDKAATDLRRQALLDFVKGGKGLAGVHAATDSYHTNGQKLTGTWPEFNEMIGGFFKFHWTYPTLIPVKVDDPNSPLTAMFPARGFEMVDETYTFAQDSFSRKRVHVLTSINYGRMSAEDKAKEPAATKRTDGDYALSYIQHVGNGRVFYEAHGHDEKIYYLRPFVAHMLAGIQYAIGDLKADDSPSVK